jgi:hypothetical protein
VLVVHGFKAKKGFSPVAVAHSHHESQKEISGSEKSEALRRLHSCDEREIKDATAHTSA